MRLGSLCSGAGMLDYAVERVFGATTAWHCELDPAASKVLAHRWPGVPNHGDLTRIDWDSVELVDILAGGYPCQPFSAAGQRKGTDDERHIWPDVREAIRRVRPRITILENVAGHRSLGFDRVLGDMAEDGLHARWTSLRAADVGAPHGRERLFIVAYPRDGSIPEWAWAAGRPSGQRASERVVSGCSSSGHLIPTPRASDAGPRGGTTGWGMRSWVRDELLPTPTTEPQTGNGHARNLGAEVKQWGKYAPAIHRWERVLGRPAPSPTEPNRNGNPRLNPAFSEWMMGWPAGWVTEVPGISRNDQLRIIGNGVIPQCAAAAIRWLLSLEVVA